MRRAITITQFGNPILRQVTHRLSPDEIVSEATRKIIVDMRATLERAQRVQKYGIALAAPQIGKNLAIALIDIKPSRLHPSNPSVHFIIINPEIVRTYGTETPMWEGCMSYGAGNNSPYAKAVRHEQIRVRFYDELGVQHEQDYDDLVAHVLQHEIDHLNGILFVDRVEDPKTYITKGEYVKRFAENPVSEID